ncbi:ArdC family protein [Methylolobus aquaticus]
MRKTTSPKLDLYTRVTDKILADLAQGVRPWLKPWNADNTVGRISRPLRANGTPYRGINVLLLWGATLENGYRNPTWLTFKQADALSAHVRKGEKGSLVVYADTFRKTETNEATGEETEKDVPFLKSYTVFNVEQIEGLPPAYYATGEQPIEPEAGRDARLEVFFKGTGAIVRHGGNRAYYTPVTDHVQMPPFAAFEDGEAYYSTLAHELTHWSGAASRLDRDFGRKRWGDEGYALEELVAELGAAFLCADLGITPEVREDHAAYIGSWLQALQNDKRCIFTAAAHAQRAVDFLLATQTSESADTETTEPVNVAA